MLVTRCDAPCHQRSRGLEKARSADRDKGGSADQIRRRSRGRKRMVPTIRGSVAGLVACAALCLVRSPEVRAETVQEFYTGKTINMIVSTGAGNIFDVTARMVAKHLPRFIPGSPNIVVRNMPGGGHIR